MGDSNTNSTNNVRRCGQIGEGEDDLITMEDAMNEQARLMEDASAVLGASDPVNCSYTKGYMNRQAIYACATCTPNGNAGICLACSYACHEGHDLHELYTKRFFCCDCGNDKFKGSECKLEKSKAAMNSRNRYNQNFRGVYCTCHKPYPDTEDDMDDEMIQCIMCEDWYHGRHLNTSAPDEFVEMICSDCMSKYPFLWVYNQVYSHEASKKEESSEDVDVISNGQNNDNTGNITNQTTHQPSSEGTKESKDYALEEKSSTPERGIESTTAHSSQDNNSPSGSSSLKRPTESSSNNNEIVTKKLKLEPKVEPGEISKNAEQVCSLKSLGLGQQNADFREHATFWPPCWRSKLCKCEECLNMYKDRDIEFLTDESDTVLAYEERGNSGPNAIREDENEADVFAGMDRVTQIEVARGVQDFKSELAVFLQGFAREGKVVTETDIREFFEQMEQKRRRRMNIPQHNCR